MSLNQSSVLIMLDDSAMGYDDMWMQSSSAHWMNGSSTYAGFSLDEGPFASLNLTFQGTSVSFTGNAPSPNNTQTFYSTIDQGSPTPYDYLLPQHYIQWYQSPILPDGMHTLYLSHLVQTDVDFAIITAGEGTPLSGTTLIVDDDNPEMVFKGDWEREEGVMFSTAHGFMDGFPLGNTTRKSKTVGDNFVFRFAGNSISVRGIFDWTATGSVSATFTLDSNSSVSKNFFVPTSGSVPYDDQPNYTFFEATDLGDGDHKLVVNVTDVVGTQTLNIDYLLYKPSFPFLSAKPVFNNDAEQGGHAGMGKMEKIIIGECVGATVAVLGILIMLFVALRQRRMRRKRSVGINLLEQAEYVEMQDKSEPSSAVSSKASSWIPQFDTPNFPASVVSQPTPVYTIPGQSRLDYHRANLGATSRTQQSALDKAALYRLDTRDEPRASPVGVGSSRNRVPESSLSSRPASHSTVIYGQEIDSADRIQPPPYNDRRVGNLTVDTVHHDSVA